MIGSCIRGSISTTMFDLKKPDTIPQSLYWSTDYLSPKRFSSIGYQWKLAIDLDKQTYLEIGLGNGILTQLLTAREKTVVTVDVNLNLCPDISGALPDLPFSNKSFEVSLCYEVLEHLPFDLFEQCLIDIARVTREYVVISIPDATQSNMGFRGKIKKILNKNTTQKKPYEHCWEIGFFGIYPDVIVSKAKSCGLILTNRFRNPMYLYHHFFIFRV